MDKRPESYMFKTHNKETVAGWAKQIKYFYFLELMEEHLHFGIQLSGILYVTLTIEPHNYANYQFAFAYHNHMLGMAIG